MAGQRSKPMTTPRRMPSKYGGTCTACGQRFEKDDEIDWFRPDPAEKAYTWHPACTPADASTTYIQKLVVQQKTPEQIEREDLLRNWPVVTVDAYLSERIKRVFVPGEEARYESVYEWEERKRELKILEGFPVAACTECDMPTSWEFLNVTESGTTCDACKALADAQEAAERAAKARRKATYQPTWVRSFDYSAFFADDDEGDDLDLWGDED